MKINTIPKGLDVILKIGDEDIILSENPTYLTPTYRMDKFFGHSTFIISSFVNNTSAIIKYYELKTEKDAISVNEKSVLEISYTENKIEFKIDSKPANISDLSMFLKNNESEIIHVVKAISFNSHCDRIGYKDIYTDLKKIYSSARFNSTKEALSYYMYFADPKMYAIAEKLIKMGIKDGVSNYNPAISGKEIPDVSTIRPLSKVSIAVLDKIKGRADNATILLSELEANSNVGVNGIKMIEEMCDLYDSIDARYSECENFVVDWQRADLYEGINEVVKQFNISIKVLINRIIKASFTENLSPKDFISLTTDYIRMSKMMELTIPEKMPKDIVKDHDLIAAQYEYIQNKAIETQFKANMVKNKELLTKLPENKFFTIISPEVPNDLIMEGLMMNHCVGTYVNRYAAGSSKIFFVRRKDDIKEPFVTVEINTKNNLVQAKARANSNPPGEVMDFIHDWLITLK